ncbi:MAG: hypothetical protein IPO37_09400 [Saprospiraceae bacterium]|nr:hypothetical protein [Saprospiraceae bacterium]
MAHNTQYTVRVYNGSNDCYVDYTLTTPDVICCALDITCTPQPQTNCTPVNGSANVNVTGAVGTVTYLWSSGEVTSSISNKAAGTYTVTVTDGGVAGCTRTCQALITNNTTNPSVTCSKTDNTNCALPNGTATATATGVTYLWSNNATTDIITGLTAGTYTVTVTSTTTGCTNMCQAVVASTTTQPTAVCTPVANTNCTNPNGTASVSTDAASATYLWSTGSTTMSISGLSAGNYTVTVTNTANSCINTCIATITNNTTNPSVTCSKTDVTNCASPNGTATATATGVTYLWSNNATTASINDLSAGTYTVTVSTTTGCTATCQSVVGSTTTLPTASCTPTDNTNCVSPNGTQ